jgi:hypothetical protein
MNIQQFLDGKKTYLVALAAIGYVLGAHLGWWTLDDKILDALGFGGLITLRAGVKKLQDGKLFEPLISANKNPNPNPDGSEDSSPLAVKTPLPALGVLCALCGILVSGCASIGSNPAAEAQRIQRLATVAELAAFSGSSYWLGGHPQDRPYFALSLAALDSLLKDRNYDPQALTAALSSLPVKQLQGDKGALIVSAATILYDGYASEVVNLDKAIYIAPVIAAIRNGLFRALNPGQVLQTATVPPMTPPGTNAATADKLK